MGVKSHRLVRWGVTGGAEAERGRRSGSGFSSHLNREEDGGATMILSLTVSGWHASQREF